MAPSRKLVNLVSVMCESLLVGAYAVLIGFVVWLLTGQRSMPTTHKVLFGASIAMFLISVAHLGLLMQQVTVDVVPLANFRAQILLATFQFIIGDLVLIWRVWVIWRRNYWVAAGPLAIMLAAAGFSFNIVSGTETRSFFITAPVAMIVVNTTICTLLIAGKIWYMRHDLQRYGGSMGAAHTSRSYRAVLLMIESGALYAAAQLTSLVLNQIESPGVSILQNLEMPLIGILPTLIILLVHFDMLTRPQIAKELTTANFGDRSYPTNTFSSQTLSVGTRMEFQSDNISEQHPAHPKELPPDVLHAV